MRGDMGTAATDKSRQNGLKWPALEQKKSALLGRGLAGAAVRGDDPAEA